jgi:hypothetical protein
MQELFIGALNALNQQARNQIFSAARRRASDGVARKARKPSWFMYGNEQTPLAILATLAAMTECPKPRRSLSAAPGDLR